MTEIEAIKELKEYAENSWGDLNESFELSIKALEKQIAKKPILNNPIINNFWCEDAKLCPICHAYVDRYGIYEYCKNCGQRLLSDWGNKDD